MAQRIPAAFRSLIVLSIQQSYVEAFQAIVLIHCAVELCAVVFAVLLVLNHCSVCTVAPPSLRGGANDHCRGFLDQNPGQLPCEDST